jgi:hypothetical protein
MAQLKQRAMSYGRMRDEEARLRAQIVALTQQAETVDSAEDAELGPDVRGYELPAELQRREQRLATIAGANARLEARQGAADREQGRLPDDERGGARDPSRAISACRPIGKMSTRSDQAQFERSTIGGSDRAVRCAATRRTFES